MKDSNFWDLLRALIWPATIGMFLYHYRIKLTELIDVIIIKIRKAVDLKLGNIELKGARIDGKTGDDGSATFDGNDYVRKKASEQEFIARQNLYNATKCLMLAHRIRPSKKEKQTYDVSVFLVRKLSKDLETARFNDVDYVEYYFGGYFGGKPHGSKFIVRNPDNGFAITTSAYGSPLCIAKIHFHGGDVAETYRYLDFEMGQVFGENNVKDEQ